MKSRPLGASRGGSSRSQPSPPGGKGFAAALRKLGRRDYSEVEMASALLRAGHAEDEVSEVLSKLKDARLLNDSALSERVARSRMGRKGIGRLRILRELTVRGVAEDVARGGVGNALLEFPEEKTLDAVARRYWALHRRVPARDRLPRLYRFLLGRGYPAGVIYDRLRALWPRLGDALSGIEPLGEPEEP